MSDLQYKDNDIVRHKPLVRYYDNGWHDVTSMKVRNNNTWVNIIPYYDASSGYDMKSYMSNVPEGQNNFGIHCHFDDYSGSAYDITTLPYTAESGAKFIRFFMYWDWCENRNTGVYNWETNGQYTYDTYISSILARGQVPVVMLTASTGSPTGGPAVNLNSGSIQERWMAWVSETVNRYKSNPIIWEIWNEPERSSFWGGTPSVSEYLTLCSYTSYAIRRVHTNSYILGPAVGLVLSGSDSQLDRNFLEGCINNGLSSYVDAVSIHPYCYSYPELTVAEYDWVRARTTLPLVVTENGWARSCLGYLAGEMRTNVENVQNWYTQRMIMLGMKHNLKFATYYTLVDDPDGTGYGMLNSSLTAQSVYSGIKTVRYQLGTLPFAGFVQPTGDGYDGWDVIMYFSNGSSHKVVWWTAYPHAGHNSVIWNNNQWQTKWFKNEPQYMTYTP